MRPKLNMAIGYLCAACLAPACANAAVVILKSSSQPIMGYLVRQDERSVTLREVLPGGKSRESSFARSNIDELIITVSPERLAALDPNRLPDYLEYAEELAEKQRDPEARETAVRLYTIVAARGDAALRRSAMLGLIAMARSAGEERKLRAAAYLFGEDHDESLLKREPPGGAIAPRSPAAITDFLAALRLLRQGKGSQARTILEKPSLRSEASLLGGIITLDELIEWSGVSQLTNQRLARVLRSELALEEMNLGRDAPETAFASDGERWSSAIKPGGLGPLPMISLNTLTEFDPAQCVFRNGKWTRP